MKCETWKLENKLVQLSGKYAKIAKSQFCGIGNHVGLSQSLPVSDLCTEPWKMSSYFPDGQNIKCIPGRGRRNKCTEVWINTVNWEDSKCFDCIQFKESGFGDMIKMEWK